MVVVQQQRKSVHLPKFEGDEKKAPFLKYPVWIDQWKTLIVEYDEKWWGTMLMDHLDDTAKGKLIGFEKNYAECMKRLQSFYGDSSKVVYCVMREVSQSVIAEGDYNSLSS